MRRRIVVAPMAGGPTTADLVVAAGRAGALGFLAAGYKTPEAMAAEISAVRAATAEPFGVNVFVPGRPCPDAAALTRYVDSLGPGRGDASWDDDGFDGKVAALLADPPAVTSFTFGCPAAQVVQALQQAGSAVAVTVASPAEAALAAEASADALCVQGYEAGARRRRGQRGHRGHVAVGRTGLPTGRRAARGRDHRPAARLTPRPAGLPAGHIELPPSVEGYCG
jgi:nitronate monooxygenase